MNFIMVVKAPNVWNKDINSFFLMFQSNSHTMNFFHKGYVSDPYIHYGKRAYSTDLIDNITSLT